MGIVAIRKGPEPEPEPEPEPKASCPSCGRPVAIADRSRCVYCAAPLGDLDLEEVESRIPPEVLLQQDPRAFRMPPGVRWGLRWGSIVLAAVLAWLLSAGSCAK